MSLEFEWDNRKEKTNIYKHDVSFHDAATVFGDFLAWTFSDPDHSECEDRFITIGRSSRGKTLVISHTDRDDRIRIISARQATLREKRQYENG